MNATSSAPEAPSGWNSDVPLLIATSCALVTLLPVAAYQLGAIHHLPDPSSKIFASGMITQSSTAHPFGIPDSLPGIGSYGVTLTLTLMSRTSPRARKLLALKLLADGTLASINLVRQIVLFKKLCSWCTGTVVCTAAMLIAGRGPIEAECRKLFGRNLSSSHNELGPRYSGEGGSLR